MRKGMPMTLEPLSCCYSTNGLPQAQHETAGHPCAFHRRVTRLSAEASYVRWDGRPDPEFVEGGGGHNPLGAVRGEHMSFTQSVTQN